MERSEPPGLGQQVLELLGQRRELDAPHDLVQTIPQSGIVRVVPQEPLAAETGHQWGQTIARRWGQAVDRRLDYVRIKLLNGPVIGFQGRGIFGDERGIQQDFDQDVGQEAGP